MKFVCSECGYEFPVASDDEETILCTCLCVRDKISDLEADIEWLKDLVIRS